MRTDRRAAGALALLVLAFVVAGLWLAGTRAGDLGGERDAAVLSASLAGATDGTGDGAPGGRPGDARTRPPRRRARAPTEEDVHRDAAREALVASVVRLREAPVRGAANVRAMRLPGAPVATPAGWKPAEARLAGSQPSAATSRLDSRPRGRSQLESLADAGSFHVSPEGADGGSNAPPRKGLRADYFDFLEGELRQVPELTKLPPTLTRIEASVDFATDDAFALPFEPETFGALWRGYLVVETPGEYEFTIGSDDGARLRIDGVTVLEHATLRPYGESGGRRTLDAGRHEIEVAFYENYVFASCRLFWSGPGFERRVVPPEAFEPPDDVAAADPPRVARVVPDHARLDDEVTIVGTGFSANAALQRVTFAGVEAEIVTASPEELVVRVPFGASTGSVVVQVGPISSRSVPFEVDTLVGLFGEYFLIGTQILDLPDFDALAPYFVRLDGPLRFEEDGLWQMPYAPDVFAVRWTGFLYVPEEDEYEVTLRSDDGGVVRIDGQVVAELPGVHPPMERSRTVALTQGFHPIELRFFENYGIARLSLFWKRRGEPTRAPVPRGCLFAPDALAAWEEPRIASVDPPTALSGEEIAVLGSGFGADPRVVRVEFPGGEPVGAVWARPTVVADDLLRVRVPHGCGTGELRVHVGIRPSAPAEFALAEPIGLRGEYFELGSGEAATAGDLPALLASRSPRTTRTEVRWRFGKASDWALPGGMRDFAVRWTGRIAVETAQNLAFAVQSESGVLLRIDGREVVADVQPHTLRERYGFAALTPGEHAVELFFLGRGADPRLHVFVTPWGRADHLELPPSWLRPR